MYQPDYEGSYSQNGYVVISTGEYRRRSSVINVRLKLGHADKQNANTIPEDASGDSSRQYSIRPRQSSQYITTLLREEGRYLSVLCSNLHTPNGTYSPSIDPHQDQPQD